MAVQASLVERVVVLVVGKVVAVGQLLIAPGQLAGLGTSVTG
jgi:hypothetical protein